MHFGFALDSSDIDLLNIDLLDTHLDLLDTDIPVNILFVSKTSWRCLQRNKFLSSNTSPRRLAECLLKNVLEDKKLLRQRRVKGGFKTCLEDQQMFAGIALSRISSILDSKYTGL